MLRILSIITFAAGIWYAGLVLFGNNGLTPSAIALLLESIVFFLLSFCLFSANRSIKRVRENLEATYIFPLRYVFAAMIVVFIIGAILIIFY